jgi:hypothetical protein
LNELDMATEDSDKVDERSSLIDNYVDDSENTIQPDP